MQKVVPILGDAVSARRYSEAFCYFGIVPIREYAGILLVIRKEIARPETRWFGGRVSFEAHIGLAFLEYLPRFAKPVGLLDVCVVCSGLVRPRVFGMSLQAMHKNDIEARVIATT